MPSRRPFLDRATGELDSQQLLAEAVPLAKLIGYFAAISLVPFGIAYAVGPTLIGTLFGVVGQFVLAVGGAVVLVYAVARGIQLSGVADGE
ncbi:hypothetical protein [Haloarcula litorea]|uniref:hypothetical protein n=1 Tax=Haloarcula litorea TaxID=3032579 RepID=UPI0023E8D4ED|nr:hypothetical protein [Halomicroarcula sp. GDY20]